MKFQRTGKGRVKSGNRDKESSGGGQAFHFFKLK